MADKTIHMDGFVLFGRQPCRRARADPPAVATNGPQSERFWLFSHSPVSMMPGCMIGGLILFLFARHLYLGSQPNALGVACSTKRHPFFMDLAGSLTRSFCLGLDENTICLLQRDSGRRSGALLLDAPLSELPSGKGCGSAL